MITDMAEDNFSINERPPGNAASHSVGKDITARRILVTGAGGSIGTALVQAIASASPACLVLLDASEHALYQIDRILNEAPAPTRYVAVLGSVCDSELLAKLFQLHRPEIVFHAAAFKQVPLLEYNPFAAVANNVLGTYALLQSAIEHKAEHLVLVSTDKAVDPLSIMGASKRIAELLLIALASSTTRLSAVRLGNVIGTQGSVVPLFLDQIAQGGPLTVTHSEVRRFFLTVDQCVHAILAALEPRSHGTVLLPHLDAPIRITDLARGLIEAHSSAASIVYTELRPGDKIEESLLSSRETLLSHPGEPPHTLTAVASSAPSAAALHAAMRTLEQAVAVRDLASLLRTVLQLVPEYTPSDLLLDSIKDGIETLQETRA
jgi:FlaA1/EpsC-like NDP-sugar epimerase